MGSCIGRNTEFMGWGRSVGKNLYPCLSVGRTGTVASILWSNTRPETAVDTESSEHGKWAAAQMSMYEHVPSGWYPKKLQLNTEGPDLMRLWGGCVGLSMGQGVGMGSWT